MKTEIIVPFNHLTKEWIKSYTIVRLSLPLSSSPKPKTTVQVDLSECNSADTADTEWLQHKASCTTEHPEIKDKCLCTHPSQHYQDGPINRAVVNPKLYVSITSSISAENLTVATVPKVTACLCCCFLSPPPSPYNLPDLVQTFSSRDLP